MRSTKCSLLRASVLLAVPPLLASCAPAPPRDSRAEHPALRHGDVAASQPGPRTRPATTGVARAVTDDLAGILNSPRSADSEKVAACEALELMGSSAAPAIDPLIAALHGDGVLRLHAGRALVAIGPAAVPALRESMNGGTVAFHESAKLVWATIELNNAESIAELRSLAANADPSQRDADALGVKLFEERAKEIDAAREASRAGDWPLATAGNIVQTVNSGDVKRQRELLRALSSWGTGSGCFAPLIRPLMESPNRDISQSAGEVLQAMGPLGVPVLIDALHSPDEKVRLMAAKALNYPLDIVINSPLRHDAIAALVQVLDDKDAAVVWAAATSLSTYGLDAHPPLVKAMKAGNASVKLAVIEQLLTRPVGFTAGFAKTHGTFATPPTQQEETELELGQLVAPDLLKKAKSDAMGEPWQAITALANLPPAAVAKEMMAAVNIWLDASPKSRINWDVATAVLRDLGPWAIPVLLQAIGNPDAHTREAAAKGLAEAATERLAPGPDVLHDPKVVDALTKALSDPSPAVQEAASKWAMTLTDPSPKLMETIAGNFQNPVDSVVAKRVRWAATLKNPSPAILRRVAELLTPGETGAVDRSLILESDQKAAIDMLGRFTSEPAACVPALAASLRSDSANIRIAAIVALRAYGENAAPALPALLKDWKDHDDFDFERHSAAATILVCGRQGRKAIAPYYVGKLQAASRMADSREAVSGLLPAIAEIGPDAPNAVPLLEGWLGNSDNGFRIEVANALGEIGPAAAHAISALTRMEDNADFDVRESASIALVKISPEGKGLGPALLAAVYNGDRSAAGRIAAAFRHVDDSKTVITRLQDLAKNDPDAGVRAAAGQVATALSPER